MKRHRFFVVALLSLGLLSSCSQWRPFGVLKPDVMEDVLYDIHLSEAVLFIKYPTMRREDQRACYDAIFAKHGITKERFEKSLVWYSDEPKRMVEIYEHLDLRYDQLANDVKTYKYHTELSGNLALDTLAHVDIYGFPYHIKTEGTPTADDVDFEVSESLLLSPGDRYVLRFYHKPMGYDTVHFDTLHHSSIRLTVFYSDGSSHTIQSPINAKGLQRRFTITHQCPDTLTPVRITGSFFSGTDSLKWLRVDSATLIRYYNAQINPLSAESLIILDSIAQESHRRIPVSNRIHGDNAFRNRITNLNLGEGSMNVRLPNKSAEREANTATKKGG